MVSSALPSTLFPALDEYRWLGLGLVIPCSGAGCLLSHYLTEMSLTLCLELLVLLGSAYCDRLEQPPPVEFRARFPTPSQALSFSPVVPFPAVLQCVVSAHFIAPRQIFTVRLHC